MARIVTGETFILILHKVVIFIKPKFSFGIFGTLLKLYADTVAFICNAGLSGVNSYASIAYKYRPFVQIMTFP